MARHTLQTPRDDKQESPFPENLEILARLKTLEDKVSAMGSTSFLSSQSPQQLAPSTPLSRTSHSTPTTRTVVDEDYRTASELLENVGASYHSKVSYISMLYVCILLIPVARLPTIRMEYH